MTDRTIPQGESERPDTAPEEGAERWHRLTPVAVLPLVIKGAVDLARQGWQAFAGMAAALHFTADDRGLLWLWIGVGLGILLIGGGILQWWHFRYALDERAIRLRRGVFARQRLHLDFDRVQNLRITAPVYLRPFGLVTLALDSAGSQSAEIVLPAVPRALAEDIARRVRAAQAIRAAAGSDPSAAAAPAAPRPDADASSSAAAETVLIRRTARDLIRQGLASNTAWVVAGLLASLLAGNPDEAGRMVVALAGSLLGPLDRLSWMAVAGLVAGGLVVMLVAILLLSVLGSLVHFHGFVLLDEGRAWRARHGLLERREVVVAKTKLQALSLRQTLIGRLLGVWELRFHQAGGLGPSHQQGGARRQKLVIPAVTRAELADILAALMPGIPWPLPAAHRPDPFLIAHGLRYLALLGAGAGGGLAVALFHGLGAGWALGTGMAAAGATVALGWLVLRRLREARGHATAPDLVVTTQGFLGRRIVLFRPFKTQWVRLQAGPALRRRRLAHLAIALAGVRTQIVYLPAGTARALAADLLHQAARDPRPWY